MASLDHLAVAAATLEAGIAHVEAALGLPMGPGGRHAAMATHNRLLGLSGGEYLEAIAIDPDAPDPGRPRWFGLDTRAGPPRLGTWIARVDDLDAACARFPMAGHPMDLARGELRWRMAVPEDGVPPFGGCFPALIEWRTAPPRFAETGIALTALRLSHPDADRLGPLLTALLDDTRIGLDAGPVRLEAAFDTPSGPRRLS